MPSNTFNRPHPPTKPPAYCHFDPIPLPPLLPIPGPAQLQGYARWTDLNEPDPVDIAMYVPMPRKGTQFFYEGQATIKGIKLNITLQRITLPNTWRLAIHCWRTPAEWEFSLFDKFELQQQPSWDTGIRIKTYELGIDFRVARVTQ